MSAAHPRAPNSALVLLLGSLWAAAAQAGPDEPATALQQVEVQGKALADDGRDGVAARTVVSREDLARFGDPSVTDVLRRVPGITVSGSQGRAGDVRMRGLGSGYTQILVNGEAVPAGYTLDALSPGQIERIEISRVATVDLGSQAIAGTINIILRQSMRKAQRELKASVASQGGRPSYLLDGQFSDRLAGVSYSVGAGLSRRNDRWPSTLHQQGSDADGLPELDRLTQRRAFGLAESATLTPKLSWPVGGLDKLSVEALLRHTRFDDRSDDLRQTSLGPPAPYPSDELRSALRTTLAQLRLEGTHTLEGGATIEARLGSNQLWRDSAVAFQGRDEAKALTMDEHVQSTTTERAFVASGKLRLPYSEGQAVALGWDGERALRDDVRAQRQTSLTGRPTLDFDEQYRATVQRLAVYAQDEWDISDALALYAGARWATLRTRTEGRGLETLGQRWSVISPVLQLLWKPPAARDDQFRLALSRSYKAPRTVDLIPRRLVAVDNTPTTPDLRGNPALRPELAWGVDLAIEHAAGGGASSWSLGASARRVQDVILDQLALEDGVWVETRANQGAAHVYGLEFDSRWRPRASWPAAPNVELRAAASRHWSRVDGLPGPDNRLDSQVPWSLNLGADWKPAHGPLAAGGSLAVRGGARARTSLLQTSTSSTLRTLDLYATWSLSPALQLRLTASNLLRPQDVTVDTVEDGQGRFRQTTDSASEAGYRIGLELKL
jgi:outer membrane receptor protein involved in Fe transport